MPKLSILVFVFAASSIIVKGQVPVIYSIDRAHAAMHERVTLHGANFGEDPAALKVLFGGTSAQILSSSDQLIETLVPAGTTTDRISVVNLTTGRTGFYRGDFVLNYQGEHGIAPSKFAAQIDVQAGSGLYDLCVCDLDGDGKPDVATANNNATTLTLLRNTSTPANPTLTPQDPHHLNARTLYIHCSDLNGDGLPDLIASEDASSGGSRIFIMTNKGGFNFSTIGVSLTGAQVNQLTVADLDADGRPEIIVTNRGANDIRILPNQSTTSTTAFGPAIVVSVDGATSTDAIATADLDGDGYPEILTSHYQSANDNKLYMLRNRGSLNFATPQELDAGSTISDIRLADLNGDGNPEIIATRVVMNDIVVFRNLSGTEISFANPLPFATELRPVSVDIADFDGDGRPDIAVGGWGGKSVTVFNNIGTGSEIALSAALKIPTTYINRDLQNVDIDGDGKPDIVFTSVDDNSGVPIPASKVSVIRNTACMTPVLTPGGVNEICSGTTLTLTATMGGGVTYQWFREGDATPVKSGPDNFLETGIAGTYFVKAQSPGCDKQSNSITVKVSAPEATLNGTPPNARSNSPVCTGNTLVLEVDDMNATAYRWSGPGNFSQTVSTPSLERSNFIGDYAGRYTVEILAGTCVAETATLLVEAITVPEFSIPDPVNEFLCEGETQTLTLTPALPSGFSVQWYTVDDGAIAGATETLLSASGGEFYAIVTPDVAGCAAVETNRVKLTSLSVPVADFNAPTTACQDDEVKFTATSVGDPAATAVYSWTVDGVPASATHTFPSSGTYDVTLTISYTEHAGCQASATKSIQVTSLPTPEILADPVALCEGASSTLSVQGEFATLEWDNGSTTADRVVNAPGVYHVTAMDVAGCSATAEIAIDSRPGPSLSVTASRTSIAAGQNVELSATGADQYVWIPGKTLNDSTVSAPVATPGETTTYTVTGTSAEGCTATATITIQVSDQLLQISVPALFSPNGDGDNELLVVEGIESYPDCTLQVYDRRGRKVYGVIGYQNNWDGSVNGTPLPQGVYYYVVGCPGKTAATGAVTIIR